ncbi:MAG: protease pro-enzyme activation domain-containing protein [Acidimicrobiales bacterium]
MSKDRRFIFCPARVGVGVAALALGFSATLCSVASASASASQTFEAVAAAPLLPVGVVSAGAINPNQAISGVVGLKSSDAAELASYAQAVSDPASPLYRHYLKPGEFSRVFASTNALGAVTSMLRGAGLRVTSVSSNGLLVDFEGSASHVETAFDTRLGDFRTSNGGEVFAPTTAVSVPTDIAADVQAVIGLNDLLQPATDLRSARGSSGGHARALAPSRASDGDGPVACPAAVSDAADFGGLTDTQIADAYGVGGLYDQGVDGTGQTIAVYELEPFARGDIDTFDTCYFGASKAKTMQGRLHVISVDGGQQTGYGSGEAELDIDDVSAVAPGATIDVYEAPNSFTAYVDNYNRIIEGDTARIVTSSWDSGCETQVAQYEPGLEQLESSLFEEAAAQGQTVLGWAGDDGADSCAYHGSSPVAPILSSNDPAANPWVLAVGGTTITDATEPPAEHVWNDGADWGAGGGGISAIWGAPTWQADSLVKGFDNQAIVAAANKLDGPFCGASVCRETPDVTAQADEFTGAVTIYDSAYGGWTTFGGTSSSTPLWGAMLTDAASTPACVAQGGIGFVPPKLYAIASDPTEDADSFNDITAGNTDIFGDTGGLFPATAGYDMASGLGSPRITNTDGSPGLASWLCNTAGSTVPVVRSVSPAAVPAGGGMVTITGSGFEDGSSPDVAGVQIGTVTLSTGAFHVASATRLTATLPADSGESGTGGSGDGAGTYDLVVTLTDGQSSPTSSTSRVTYYPTDTQAAAPSVDGVDTDGGSDAGGITVHVFGAGFKSGGTPSVTFGGINGTNVRVLNDNDLTVTAPPYSSATKCATNLNALTDVCQTEVRVTTSAGSSPEETILPEFSGPVADEGTAGTEVDPVATEFDYVASPKLDSIKVQGGLASEAGTSTATIKGQGLGDLGLEWLDVGPYRSDNSFMYDLDYISPTKLVVTLPAESATSAPLTLGVYAQTLASPNSADIAGSAPSNRIPVTYAPTPTVTSVTVVSGGKTQALSAGPTTGGTDVVIAGTGLGDSEEVVFTDVGTPGSEDGFSDTTAFDFNKVTGSVVKLVTTPDNPGIDQVSVCDQSGCSAAETTHDTFTYYPPGNPSLVSVSPGSGPAGTSVTIDGSNLGFVTGVWFGNVEAITFANVPALTDAGNTSEVTATAPPQAAGSKVDVRVETLESAATGFGKSPVNPKASFKYTN